MTRHVVFPLLAIYFQRKFQILIQRKRWLWNFPEFSTFSPPFGRVRLATSRHCCSCLDCCSCNP
ncbi:Remorin family protein [Zea mays]|uniref:Remorin family protein n=1 Tax=Zea mays TaxID=4577 RepID=A0A1D6E4R5_MAIZE|nr:Remorin family protein [Zea mays]